MLKIILDTLFALTHPRYWIKNEKTNKQVDKWFVKKIKEGNKFTNISKCEAFFCGKRIWVANRPYSCFLIKDESPKRRTIYRLEQVLFDSILDGDEQ